MSENKSQIFESRREMLIASVGSDQKAFSVVCGDVEIYALAGTVHQAGQAFLTKHVELTQLDKKTLQQLMAEELKNDQSTGPTRT